METGKVTITFHENDTHDFEIKGINGLDLIEAAAEIINEINKYFNMPIKTITSLIEKSIGEKNQD